MDPAFLLARLAREFAVTGASTPPWPDPHEGLDGPRDDEYSRCLEPGKYRIVAARAEAWARALEGTGHVDREPVADPAAVWDSAARHEDLRYPAAERGEWLRPHEAGALPLLLTTRSVDAADNHLDIGAGDPAIRLLSEPYCGCDACDSGSDDLLTVIDETILQVVTGELLHITTDVGTIQTTDCGWSARGPFGAGEIERILDDARAGSSAHRVVRGAPWW